LQELENEIIKCNPRSKEALMLSDELNTSIGRIKDIFFLRKNKLFVMVAQASSADMINSPHKNYNRLLPEEKRLYESLTQSGKNLKTELLDPVISSNNEGKKNFIA
jgi:DNA replication factor GINS